MKQITRYHNVYFIGLFQVAHQPNSKSLSEAKNNLELICKSVMVHPFQSFKGRISWYLLVMMSLLRSKSYKEAWCKSTDMVNSIKWMIRGEPIDLVHFDTVFLLQYYEHIPIGVPIAINHHNVESQMMLRRCKNEGNWFLKLYFYLEAIKILKLEKKYCPKGINLVVSDLDKCRLKKVVPDGRVSVIPNGVDLFFFKKLDVPKMQNTMVFVGGLTWYPNVDAMRFFCKEVWPKLTDQTENVKLIIIGRDPPKDLKEFSRRDPRIQFMGFVEDIRPILSAATVYVCPMRQGGGTRLKVLDAMAMGMALVATTMACEGINLKDNESVLLAETADEFAEKIMRLFSDIELCNNLGKNARRIVEEQYAYEKIGLKLKECYEAELQITEH